MELLLMGSDFKPISIIDSYESLLWVDRYTECGDFEIYTSIASPFVPYFLSGDGVYLWSRDSEHAMVVEDFQIDTDVENDNHITITGRSLESILDRRIVWAQTILKGDLQTEVERLLNENVINPAMVDRKIPNFIFESSTDPRITSLEIEAQYTGDNLYDVVNEICLAMDIGYKITLTDSNQFKFQFYCGADRSYDQIANPYVIFSPKFENLVNSSYVETRKTMKTVTLVAGEGEGSARVTTSVDASETPLTGIERRELFTDARDLSRTIDGGTLSQADYLSQLTQRGREDLARNTSVRSFEGQAETRYMYKYGQDFSMGDIVQLVNEYGIEDRVRVIEFIRSVSRDGVEAYPTFVSVQ